MTMLRHVTLSDGTRVVVRLRPQSVTEYYPDVPHCMECGISSNERTMEQCSAPVRDSHAGICGRYICAGCIVRYAPIGRAICSRHKE